MNNLLRDFIRRKVGPYWSALIAFVAVYGVQLPDLDEALQWVQGVMPEEQGGLIAALIAAVLAWIFRDAPTDKATPTPAPEPTPTPNIDAPLFDEADYTAPAPVNYFSQQELECRGKDCGCEYPGMHPTVLAIANDLRRQFGPIIVTSGYRCPEHNATVGGASNSFHARSPGMAIDLKSANATPQALYNYLTDKYPSRYGIGLYRTFVHIDCRTGTWARKSGADAQWRAFDYPLA